MHLDKKLTLISDVKEIPLIGPSQSAKLSNLNIFTVRDLLYHFPVKYRDTSKIISIKSAKLEKEGTIKAEVLSIKNNYTRGGKVITKATVSDGEDKASIIWFNQRFLTNAIHEGDIFLFEIKLPKKEGAKDFYCSDYEKLHDIGLQSHLGRITPFYDQTAGVSSKWLRARMKFLEQRLDTLVSETLPSEILKKNRLISLLQALKQIHFPEDFEDVMEARARLGFDEMLDLAIKLEKRKNERCMFDSPPIKIKERDLRDFISTLQFELTKDQRKAITEILEDISDKSPMNRLLNGDVGSGKTVVAAVAAYAAAKSGLATVIMAPTTLLAQQHYRSFTQMLQKFDIKIQLLTAGEILEPTIKDQIIIGTHAILYEQFLPKNIGLVIIDEQHRFGVEQREKVKKQSQQKLHPHYLTMSATPIPRTLTNVLYGDMEVSIIKEMPKNRVPIETHVVSNNKADACFRWIAEQVTKSDKNQQAYIIFPLIEQSEKTDLNAATNAYKELSKSFFKELKVGLLHGKLKENEKDKILIDFKKKKFNILISTTVIEVGIDIADASIILVENAERFGLAQLHQLRGRVGRGSIKSYCFVIPSKEIKESSDQYKRLQFFSKHTSGFDVAEYDLRKRGPGEVYGAKQSGIPIFKIADITDLALLKQSREVARSLLSKIKH